MAEITGSITEVVKAAEPSAVTRFGRANRWCRVSVHTGKRTYSVTGFLRKPAEGDFVVIEGEPHFQKGQPGHIDARTMRREVPTSGEAIENLIASLPGVSNHTARALLQKEGPDVLTKLLGGKVEVPQSEFLAKKLAERLDDALAYRTLTGVLGLTPFSAMKVAERLGRQGQMDVRLKANPYIIADTDGVDFATLDRAIVANAGLRPDDPRRVMSAAKFVLRRAGLSGHTCMEFGDLGTELRGLGFPTAITTEAALRENLQVPGLVPEPVKIDGAFVAHPELWSAEVTINRYVRGLMVRPQGKKPKLDINPLLTDEQRKGVENASGPVSVITGGPGHGKTFTIQAIVEALGESKVLLCAPTGKAAKRITEATGFEAQTLHSLLATSRDGDPRSSKTLLIDESSMVSVDLLAEVLDTVRPGRLILVGDFDQLPAVGPGRVLGDMIDSGLVPVTRLTKVQRQAADSQIVLNAERIQQGQPLQADAAKGDFFITRGEPSKHLELLCKAMKERIPAMKKKDGTPMDPLWDVQVLSPQHNGMTGVAKLNDVLREILNPREGKQELRTRQGVLFRVGDKVLVTRNMREAGLVNGDVGMVEKVRSPGQVDVTFDNLVKPISHSFNGEDLGNLQPGFSATVHKSQGSEWPMVIAVFNSETPPIMRARNLLYTAVTRARERVWVLGSDETINQCIANTRPSTRNTSLQRLLTPPLSVAPGVCGAQSRLNCGVDI